MHNNDETVRELSTEEIACIGGGIFTVPLAQRILQSPPLIDPLIDLPAPGPTDILFA